MVQAICMRSRALSKLALCLLFAWGNVLAADIPPPKVTARAYVLMDARTGTELAAQNADAPLPPASLTKLMTAYVLFGDLRAGHLKLGDLVPVSRYAARLPGARMFLREGDQVPVEALFKGMLVQSGNDATFALIEKASGDLPTFVARMNAAAAQLGLTHSHFANATGLNNLQHYSSARDLARLAIAIKRDYPEYVAWFSLKEYRWADIAQLNRNPLLGDPGVDGLKTGHTENAGYCLVASAERDGMQLIATLLGAQNEQDRRRDGRQLLDFGFKNFESRLLYRRGEPIGAAPLWQGEIDSVALGIDRELWVTLPRATFDNLQIKTQWADSSVAPVTAGQTLGQLTLTYQGVVYGEYPLRALASVAPGGFAKRNTDRLRLWWRGQGLAQGP